MVSKIEKGKNHVISKNNRGGEAGHQASGHLEAWGEEGSHPEA